MAAKASAGKGPAVIKRHIQKILGIFIDGVELDRAARRLGRRVNYDALVQSFSSGITPAVARYYTLIPYEDDSRHRAFLDAIERAGLAVIVKRLPPKGVNRQASIAVEMASDIVAFAAGRLSPTFHVAPYRKDGGNHGNNSNNNDTTQQPVENGEEIASSTGNPETKRVITVVCPSRDLGYPISLARELGADTVNADFSSGNDVLKSAAKWIDLSGTETIWLAEQA